MTTVITEQASPQESADGIDQAKKKGHHRQLSAISGTQLVLGIHHVGLQRFD